VPLTGIDLIRAVKDAASNAICAAIIDLLLFAPAAIMEQLSSGFYRQQKTTT
jgi:hypothetical protein